jgi:hypothetical protein
MSGVTEEDRRRSRIHEKVHQSTAHIPIVNLVNAARHSGWCKGKGEDQRAAIAEEIKYRDELEKVIADMWGQTPDFRKATFLPIYRALGIKPVISVELEK